VTAFQTIIITKNILYATLSKKTLIGSISSPLIFNEILLIFQKQDTDQTLLLLMNLANQQSWM